MDRVLVKYLMGQAVHKRFFRISTDRADFNHLSHAIFMLFSI